MLHIEGTSIAADVEEFLREREPVEKPAVDRNTVWPTARTFHLPLVGTNRRDLLALAERHAEPEIADHLVVYRGDEVLLWAPDAGDGRVYVSRAARREIVERLELALGLRAD